MLPVVGSTVGILIEPVVTAGPEPERTIDPPSMSGTRSRMIDAVTGSIPKFAVEPKLEPVTGSKKISGEEMTGTDPVSV
jgi:hypothetical protein